MSDWLHRKFLSHDWVIQSLTVDKDKTQTSLKSYRLTMTCQSSLAFSSGLSLNIMGWINPQYPTLRSYLTFKKYQPKYCTYNIQMSCSHTLLLVKTVACQWKSISKVEVSLSFCSVYLFIFFVQVSFLTSLQRKPAALGWRCLIRRDTTDFLSHYFSFSIIWTKWMHFCPTYSAIIQELSLFMTSLDNRTKKRHQLFYRHTTRTPFKYKSFSASWGTNHAYDHTPEINKPNFIPY